MEIINVKYSGFGQKFQDISGLDNSLISSNYINSVFGNQNDYVELYIYGEDGDLLETEYNYGDFRPLALTDAANNTYSSVTVDPEKDAKSRGYTRGKVTLQYNFYRLLFNSSVNSNFWIKEISRSRTELKLASQVISDVSIRQGFDSYRAYIGSKNYYPVFYLNFQNNRLVIANNVAYTEDADGAYLLIKLYEPLPEDFDLKSTLWMVDKVAESVSYQVTIDVQTEVARIQNNLKGPNYNVDINNKTGQSTTYYNYNNLISSPVTSSFQKLASWYQDKAISINLDFSNFSNFVHFSSAEKRVENFVEKLRLIESAESNIGVQRSIVSGSSTIVSQSVSSEQKFIDNVIKNFDIYEYFLYFESSSFAWPKSNSTQPYTLYSVTSSQASNFLGSVNTVPTAMTASLLFSASYYDSNNKDILRNSIPQYLLDDPANEPFTLFLDMIGQHFDNIWVYYKDVTNRYNATNNPYTGISMDMVADALKGLGLALYTNSNVSDNLYYTLFGINADGSLLPPTGSELITRYVTSSLNTLPAEQIQDEYYKRLYHNLPYLYKTKGTLQGLKALISIYGIPEEILSVREYGGNVSSSLKGIIDLGSSDFKVNIVTGSGGNVTGSLQISSSLLSPYTTIQYFQGNTRLSNTTIEVGFSPSDVINNNITSSLDVNVEQLIGSPSYMYSSSYAPLVSASNAYFSNYTQRSSIWEYVRLLKFYNNSLFKTIKEFVPARANVSTGIIVKSHMLERNKYARHEPSMSINLYSQSIDIGYISGSSAGMVKDSTSWAGFFMSPLGLVSYSSSNGIESFTGEFSGSKITVTDGLAIEQGDYLSHTTGSYEVFSYGALYQNITGSVRSTKLIDLDYSTNQVTPVNYGAVTYSLNQSVNNSYAAYKNLVNPFAEVQDYNYAIERSTKPRYQGSQTISSLYSTYTDGDSSYGKTAAIDKIKYQYAYIVNIFSASFQMPARAKGQIKYIIDNDQNVLNLSKTNTNWFAVQNIFKAGESADVSLFDYDPTNPYVQRLNNSENDFTIWESGYSYTPLIYNNSGSLTYVLSAPIVIPGAPAVPATIQNLRAGIDYDYWTTFSSRVYSPYGGVNILEVTASAIVGPPTNGTTTAAVTVNYYISNPSRTPNRWPASGQSSITIPAGTNAGTGYRISPTNLGSSYNTWAGDVVTFVVSSETTGSSGTPAGAPTITSTVNDSAAFWRINTPGNLILLSPSQSYYYNEFTSTGSYSGLDGFVFPFNVSNNDMVRLFNYSTSRWDQDGEFRVINVNTSYASASVTYVALTVDREIPIQYSVSSSGYPLKVERYLILKRLQDETSVYFNYDLPQPINQEGTLFPQYIGEGIKEGSGNVIKALKQQNLI